MEEELENEAHTVWLENSFTRKLAKHYVDLQAQIRRELECAASHSEDAKVREAYAKLVAARVIHAELTGKDKVEGAGQQ